MKSGKQRRAELAEKKKALTAKQKEKSGAAALHMARQRAVKTNGVPVNRDALALHACARSPEFVKLGFYVDVPFECVECGRAQIWTATQQKWWYEVAHGDVWTIARRCRECRRSERERRESARRDYFDGIARKSGPTD